LLATVSGNDLGLVLFELLSLFAWLRWQRGAHRSWLVISALLMGAALGTKYSAAFFLTGFGLAWVMCVRQPPAGMERAVALRQAALWLLMVTAVASPWYLRTFWATGHPFYPALAAIESQPFMDTAGLELLRRDLGTGGVPPSLWADYLPRLAAQDIGWLTLAAAIVGVVSTIQRPALRPLLPFIIGALPVWWLVSPVPRYLLPVVALLALFAAAALSSMAVRGRAWRGIIVSLLAAGMIGQWSVAAGLIRENYRAPWQGRAVWYWPDGPARSRWLAWSVPPYAVIDIANRTLPPSATVLFVGEYRGYYLRRDRIIGTKYNHAPLIQWAEASPTPEALAARLRDAGVTHLLYNQIEARRLEEAGYPAFDWPDLRSRELFERFRRELLTPIAVENGVVLYAMRAAVTEPAR
jgi:4-amino-4-deoxy-L-arabinose transferase-like glycosyltransferase